MADLVDAIYGLKTRYYIGLLNDNKISLRSGIVRLINEIRADNLRLAIATASSLENVTALISQTLGKEAVAWFDVIATGDLVMAKKPSPAIYEHCLEQLTLSPAQCLVIEDSENGVNAAVAANIATIVTFNDYTKQDDFKSAVAIFDQLGAADQACQQTGGQRIRGRYVTLKDLKAIHARS
ncbi:UNVERIFIED_CONTAM: hypothetical protein GTU68_017380 [Idotea baltica]|nr:hypothetical protein [Idotea baltica]